MSSILEETDPHDPDFSGPTYDEEDVTAPETAPEILNGEHVINVLLVGTDTDGSYRGHSDSMILCTIDTEKKTVVMTSFLRDMYMPITGFGQSGHAQERINVSYLSGGFPMLYDTLRDNFGVVVDYGVEVNFNSFAEVIDQVGGVDITLTANEAAHLRGKGYDVQEGLNHMDGETALAHARNRTTGGSGDLLSGIILSFAAQGMPLFDSAVCGAYIHGMAGDLAANKYSMMGTTPLRMLETLPAVLLQIEKAM